MLVLFKISEDFSVYQSIAPNEEISFGTLLLYIVITLLAVTAQFQIATQETPPLIPLADV